MGLRDKTKELALPNGVYSANAIADLDLLYGVFDDATDAFNSVLVSERKVGKKLAIYTDSTKTYSELYLWCTDLSGVWGFQPVNDKTASYQIITIGEIITDIPTMKVTVGVHKIGVNQIRLNNSIYTKSTISEFSIDPIVTSGNFRKDIIEARPNSTLFYLKKGVESTNPVAPNVTSGGMLISEVLVTNLGPSVSPITKVITDSTLKGDGTATNPIGLSASQKAEIAGKEDARVYKYGTFNPPTLAQLATAPAIRRGDTYVQTSNGLSTGTVIQVSEFNGFQLNTWFVTTAEFNSISADQKAAVKSMKITI